LTGRAAGWPVHWPRRGGRWLRSAGQWYRRAPPETGWRHPVGGAVARFIDRSGSAPVLGLAGGRCWPGRGALAPVLGLGAARLGAARARATVAGCLTARLTNCRAVV